MNTPAGPDGTGPDERGPGAPGQDAPGPDAQEQAGPRHGEPEPGGSGEVALPGAERSVAAPGEPDGGTTVGRLAVTVERLRREVQAAHAAADGRALVELAKGVLVERLGCGPVRAAEQLALLAERAGVTQLELAADIINKAASDRLAEAAYGFVARTNGSDEAPAHERFTAAVRLRTAESGALAADDTQAVAESLLANALASLGAAAVAVWTAHPDGSLSLSGSAGFSEEEAGRWCYVPPGVATVARAALTERAPVFFPSAEEAGTPTIGRTQYPSGARAAFPAGTGGRVLGVLEVCWPQETDPQPPRIVRQLEALAELCAHTLETLPAGAPGSAGGSPVLAGAAELADLADGLYDPALVLLPLRDDRGNLTDFRIHHVNGSFVDPAGRPRGIVQGATLLEAYPLVAGDGGLFDKVERVYATGERFFARQTALTALVDEVPLTAVGDLGISRHGDCVLLIWRVEDESARLASLLQHAQRLGRIGGFEENVVTGEITWNEQLYALYSRPATALPVPLEELPAHAHPDDNVALGRFLRAVLHQRRSASAAFRLQRPDGVTRHMRVVAEPVLDTDGRLLAVRGAYQDISAQHWTEVALAATRDQLAHTEQQSAERNRLALQLQHAIMPPTHAPLAAPGLLTAVRYRPAETEHLVGGDWYDAFILPTRQVLLCVGDVAGHGIEAATSMVVLRNALRGLAVTGAGPAQLMAWLNTVAHHLTEQITATAVCGLYDPESRRLRWARAGHLPPILVRGHQASELPLLGGVLLGARDDASYEEGELHLEEGDTLLMYTDGLIERRDRSVQDSLDHLLVTAQGVTASLEQRLDRLLTHSKSDTDDDTCVVGIQVAAAGTRA